MIQHLDSAYASLLVGLLSRETVLPVREAAEDMVLERDHVYVILPDRMLGVHHRRLVLLERQEDRGLHLPVDYFLRTLVESLGTTVLRPSIQIFGTDIDAKAIENAGIGLFGEDVVAQISPQRLRRFFVRTPAGYRIAKGIRDLCVFAVQNPVEDPPFARLDLVSCRNLLIALDVPLQRRVLEIFHYALNPNRFLLLGTSESMGPRADLFALVNQKAKIYLKKSNA